MLDLIRSNSQSFGVKLAFGIIILVFVFWGIGSITDTGSVNVVAMVNGQPITFQTFEMAYRRAEEQANQSNPGRRWTDQDKSQLGHQVFQSLLSEELLVQEAGKNGFSVSPLELRKYVENIPAFRNDKGQFDPRCTPMFSASSARAPLSLRPASPASFFRKKWLPSLPAASGLTRASPAAATTS